MMNNTFTPNSEARFYSCHPEGDGMQSSEHDAISNHLSGLDAEDIAALVERGELDVYVWKPRTIRRHDVVDADLIYERFIANNCLGAEPYPEPSERVKVLAEMLAEEVIKEFGLVDESHRYLVDLKSWAQENDAELYDQFVSMDLRLFDARSGLGIWRGQKIISKWLSSDNVDYYLTVKNSGPNTFTTINYVKVTDLSKAFRDKILTERRSVLDDDCFIYALKLVEGEE